MDPESEDGAGGDDREGGEKREEEGSRHHLLFQLASVRRVGHVSELMTLILPTAGWEKTLDIVVTSMISTCDVDRT